MMMLPISITRFAAPLMGLLMLAACTDPRANAPLPKNAPTPVATRVMVMAGDALIIDGRHYALADVVAPQSIPDARCWAEAVASKYATQRVKEMVRDAKTIAVKPTGKFDSYNRAYAFISLDGLDLGQMLYDEGAAAKPLDGTFRWCEQISRELDGGPTWSSMSEPMR